MGLFDKLFQDNKITLASPVNGEIVPIMMFGLPGGALAMYHTAKDSKKKSAASLLLAGSLASIFTGITEPLEFAFMFMAPGLYLVHALLTGVSAAICTLLPLRLGFNFSAGLVYEKAIKNAGVAGVIRPSKTAVQVIIGPKVQFVHDELKKLL